MNGQWKTVGVILSMLIAVGSAVAAHFTGIQDAKQYTDQEVKPIEHRLRGIEARQAVIETNTEWIKKSMEKRGYTP